MRNSQFAGETTVERGPCCAYADWENKWSKWSNVQETKLGEDESGKATRERWGGRRRQDYKGWGTGKPRIVLEVEHQPPHHFLLSDCILVFPSYLNNRFKKNHSKTILQLPTWILDIWISICLGRSRWSPYQWYTVLTWQRGLQSFVCSRYIYIHILKACMDSVDVI